MTVVEQLHSAAEVVPGMPAISGIPSRFTWEERRQGHGRRRSDRGMEFAISFPNGTILKDGNYLVLEPEKTIVAIGEAPEMCTSCVQLQLRNGPTMPITSGIGISRS